jgi:hypothetical protein
MDQIEPTATTELTQTCSAIPANKSTRNTPTKDEALALYALINRARALNGWKMQDFTALEKRMLVWWDALRQYRIPAEHWRELFDLAFDERQRKISDGKDVPVEAALLVSCWSRPHGLRETVEQRRVDAGRTLAGNAASLCPRCHGNGREYKFDIDGKILGVVGPCDHRELSEEEQVLFAT